MHHSHFHPLNLNQHRLVFHSSRTVKTSQQVQPAESAQISGLACTSRTKTGSSNGHSYRSKTVIQLWLPKNKKAHRLTLLHSTQKNCVIECVNFEQILMKFHHKTKKIKKNF